MSVLHCLLHMMRYPIDVHKMQSNYLHVTDYYDHLPAARLGLPPREQRALSP